MVPAQKEGIAVKAADSTKNPFTMMKILNEGMIKVIDRMDSTLQASEQWYGFTLTGAQE